MVTETCGTCRFWTAWRENKDVGVCRRYPPQISEYRVHGHWPSPAASGWCGEWQSKTKEGA